MTTDNNANINGNANVNNNVNAADAAPKPAATALAEDKMEQTPVIEPSDVGISTWSWETILFVLTQIRLKWVFWVLLPVGVLGTLYWGFKPGGTYQGYDAGSILSPKEYTDYGTGDMRKMFGMLTADDLNDILAQGRALNMKGFVGFLVFTLVVVALALLLSWAFCRNVLSAATKLTNDDDLYRFFREEYRNEHGGFKPSAIDSLMDLPLTVAAYSIEWLLRPGAAQRVPAAKQATRYAASVMNEAKTFFGRLYLLFDGLLLDSATGTAKRFIGGTSAASAPAPAPAFATPAPTFSGAPASVSSPVPNPVTPTPAPATAPITPPTPVASPTPAAAPMAMAAPIPTASPIPIPTPAAQTVSSIDPIEPTVPAETPTPTQPPQPAQQFKFCAYCGAKLLQQAKFCSHCGNKAVS